MRVTVCEMNEDRDAFARDWLALVDHVRANHSEVVLLPEMPFARWCAATRDFEQQEWDAAVAKHDEWVGRLDELSPAIVLGSRSVTIDGRRHNEGFCWHESTGYRGAHLKYYLPEEPGFWEASWYERGDGRFTPVDCGEVRIGFQICTDLWFMQHSRAYGKAGVHLLANPRATWWGSRDKWLAGGRAAAVVSGAYCISSNRVSPEDSPVWFGGLGWIIDPDGEVLARTSGGEMFVTAEVDIEKAREAKSTYPRYVLE